MGLGAPARAAARGRCLLQTTWSTYICACLLLLRGAAASCDVREHGATGDGVTNDSAAFYAALTRCRHVVVPHGRYVVAQVWLQGRGARLHLRRGARLLASTDHGDYSGGQDQWYAVAAYNCTDCALTGEGDESVIDGRVEQLVTGAIPGDRKLVRNWADASCARPRECRPRLIGVIDSARVALKDFAATGAAYWTTHVIGSRDVALARLRVTGDRGVPNNDGVDIDSSVGVTLVDTQIDTADDAVCVKTTRRREPTRRVRVARCVLRSRSAAVKVGSETAADISDVTFSDLTIQPSHRGLGIQLRDAGTVARVTFRNVTLTALHDNATWWGGGEALTLTRLRRVAGQARLGALRDVVVEDVAAVAEAGIVLVGEPDAPLGSVTLRRVALRLARLTTWPGARRDLQPGAAGIEAPVGIDAVYARHASRVTVEGLNVTVGGGAEERGDWREAVHVAAGTVRHLALTDTHLTDLRAPGGLQVEHPPELSWGVPGRGGVTAIGALQQQPLTAPVWEVR